MIGRAGKGSLETILIAEDDITVLAAVGDILDRAGFVVLRASSGEAALRLETEYAGPIHLLLSDVMMPAMTGPDLAKQLKIRRPEMRIMLMSGYSGGDMLVLNYGWYFIQKPFIPVALVGRINDVLHSALRDQGTDHFDTRL